MNLSAFTSCTRADSESVSDCAVPSQSDRECLDLRTLQDGQASVHPRLPASANPLASVTLERLRHSHKGATIIPLTKNKLSSSCNCVWLCRVWILSRKNNVPVSARRSLQYPCRARRPRDRIGFCTAHAWKSTRIVRPFGSLNLTKCPASCWNRAPLAVRIPGSSNGTVSWILDRTCVKLCTTVKKQSIRACLRVEDKQLIVMIQPFC